MKNEIVKHPAAVPEKSSLKDKMTKNLGHISNLKASLSIQQLPRLYNQLVIFILDGSRSMQSHSINKIPKSQDIEINIRGVIERLKSSKNCLSFDIASIVFSNHHINCFGIKTVVDLESNECFDPIKIIKEPKGTLLRPSLIEAKRIIESYFKKYEGKNNCATILLMTDGMLDDYQTSLELAEEIKSLDNVNLSVSYLEQIIEEGSRWFNYDETTGELDQSKETPIEEVREKRNRVSRKLAVFATEGAYFKNSVDPESIRTHMINSISLTSRSGI